MEKTRSDIKERTFDFSVQTVRYCEVLIKQSGASRELGRQLLRAATSIGANVEESQAASSKPDFIHKISIALKEARETRYWLRLIKASGMDRHPDTEGLLDEADQLCRILGAIAVSSKRSKG